MATLLPFRGVLYNPEVAGAIQDVVAPPYDVIDSESQRALYARNPHNVIRLELGMQEPGDDAGHNRYTRAAGDLEEWLRTGALRRDDIPALYPYTIEYDDPAVRGEGAAKRKTLKGLMSLMKLEDFGSGRVLPHENTRAAAKSDRLSLLEACRANLSPIFSLFPDSGGRVGPLIDKMIASQAPRIDFVDEVGFRQRLWTIIDPDIHKDLAAAMDRKSLFIADGHHRYETALTYRNQQRERSGLGQTGATQPWDCVLMLCSSLDDPGLTVLPTHRVLKCPVPSADEIRNTLRPDFGIEDIPFGSGGEAGARTRAHAALRERGRKGKAFCLALKGLSSYMVLELRSDKAVEAASSPREGLDVSILHAKILAPLLKTDLTEHTVVYTKDDDEALDWVHRGEAEAAFLLNPPKVTEVSTIASAGERMPHKSTYFFPKPLTGLVMHVMGDRQGER